MTTLVEGTVNCNWGNYSKSLTNIYMDSFFFLLLLEASVRSSWMEDMSDFSCYMKLLILLISLRFQELKNRENQEK